MTHSNFGRSLAFALIALVGISVFAWGITMTNQKPTGPVDFAPASVVPLATQSSARLTVDVPLPEPLSKGLVVIRYRTENLRILPVYGPAALTVSPRVGHLHITLNDAPWHWVDPSGEPIIVQGLPSGKHKLLIELADPTHKVIDSAIVEFEIPARTKSHR